VRGNIFLRRLSVASFAIDHPSWSQTFLASADNLSDIFTKQLKLPDFNRLRLAIMSAPPAPLLYYRGLGRCEPAPTT
jgi:hypothetical protein